MYVRLIRVPMNNYHTSLLLCRYHSNTTVLALIIQMVNNGLQYYGDNEDETAENFAQYSERFQGFLLMGLACLLFEVALHLTWLRMLP